jgi:hypothetical protein
LLGDLLVDGCIDCMVASCPTKKSILPTNTPEAAFKRQKID